MNGRRSPLFTLEYRSGLEWITLLISLLLLGGFIAWSLANERSIVASSEQERLFTQARVIDVHITQQLAAIRRVLINVRQELPKWQQSPLGLSMANQRLSAFGDALVGVRNLGILDADGTLIASNLEPLINRNFRDRDYFQATLNHPDPDMLHVSPPFTAYSGNWVIMLTMSVMSEEGELEGIVAAALDPALFRAALNSVNYTDDMWSAIAHGDGLQFMMEPDRPGQAGMNLAQPGSFFSRHTQSGKRENILSGTVYSTGEFRMMALRTIQPPQLRMDKPLVIAVGRDLNSVFIRWKEQVVVRGGLFLLLVLVTTLGLKRLQRTQLEKEQNDAEAASAIRQKNSELEVLNQRLRSLALVDGLTGVANRRRFDEVIDKEWRRCRRGQLPLALLMVDIDHFKDYNDHYGHQAGDECLRQIAVTLKNTFTRGSDLVARYGGEEFVCLLPESDLDGALARAESLRSAVERLAVLHEHSSAAPIVTISIGVAVIIPDEVRQPQSLVALADEALYLAKAQGRNRICANPSSVLEESDNTVA